MTSHHCPRLQGCLNHPRWRTLQLTDGRTRAIPPGPWPRAFFGREDSPTHAEAIAYATRRARAQQLEAIQNQEPCS